MPSLKVVGYVVTVATLAIWGSLYFSSGASTLSNMTLLFGGSLAGTCFALDWAESYTS